MSILEKKIGKVFLKYITVFTRNNFRTNRLTEYEKSIGFTESSRKGSKAFCNNLGYFMEEIWYCSILLEKAVKMKGLDAVSKKACFEFKNRYDTMKGSLVYHEISGKIKYAIENNLDFYLIILVDKNKERNIPLHKFISRIEKIKGYDETRHRMISDIEAFNYFFGEYNGIRVKRSILNYLNLIGKYLQ